MKKRIVMIIVGILVGWGVVGTGLALLLGKMVGLADEIELDDEDFL